MQAYTFCMFLSTLLSANDVAFVNAGFPVADGSQPGHVEKAQPTRRQNQKTEVDYDNMVFASMDSWRSGSVLR